MHNHDDLVFNALYQPPPKPPLIFRSANVQAVFATVFDEIKALREAGQKEYSVGEDKPFSNFESLGIELKLPRESILWVYFRKHIDGIRNYLTGHRSQRESVKGRINDAIVYLILLRAMIEENEANGK